MTRIGSWRENLGPLVDRVRLWSIPEPNTGCWLWLGVLSEDGYPKMVVKGRRVFAHRVAYSEMVGAIPDGMQLDHLCRTRCCVNPDHLEPVTQQENIARGRAGEHNRSKTHCPSGHPFDETNTRWHVTTRRTWRSCKTCDTQEQRDRYARRKAVAA